MLSKEDIVKGIEVSWSGVFNASELYEGIKGWLEMRGFGDEKKSFIERDYIEKIQGDTKTIEFSWSSEKNNDPYTNFMINITVDMNGLKEVEAEENNQKYKTNSGKVKIKIDGVLIKDPENKWNPVFQKLYENMIIRSRLDSHREDLYNTVYALHDTIKDFLHLRK